MLDMRLPKMGGLEVLKTLRDRGTKIPVIMITAFGDVRVAVEAMKYGAYDFFENRSTIRSCWTASSNASRTM